MAQHDQKHHTLPWLCESWEKVVRDAPKAIETLKKMKATDLIDILGLDEFVNKGDLNGKR